ncbi:hypothetical protein TRFO_20305 [Tritrichomonas foetus]|uniref:Fungal lipase-type domain-containing protein n=1 Tax=Tritrichomonas foetus TaxID=1144522 RepID=A0A1J4KL45_9EUKA|nr:hypothetical protein TRFO_20305 [Tritrichomonas foetus]|eukprot:OHT10422.1 hypothetical protein TRFO_20305 [Tritrichomonas foetus]
MMQMASMIYNCPYLTKSFKFHYSQQSDNKNQCFYVVSIKNDLYVIIRGAKMECDYLIASNFAQIKYEKGYVHKGFHHSALFIINKIESIISKWNGTIYVVGHSTGGGTASMIVAHFIDSKKMNNIYGVTIGAIPSMTLNQSKKYINRIFSFQNDIDVIPQQTIINMRNYTNIFTASSSLKKNKHLKKTEKFLLKQLKKIASKNDSINPMWVTGMITYIPRLFDHIDKSFQMRYHQMYLPGTIILLSNREAPQNIPPEESHRQCFFNIDTIQYHDVKMYTDIIKSIIAQNTLKKYNNSQVIIK